MDRRGFERAAADLYADFSCGGITRPAVVTNISKNGMRIDSKPIFPDDVTFEVIIPFREEELKVSAKLKRIIIKGNTYEGIAVEILNPSGEYLEIIDRALLCKS